MSESYDLILGLRAIRDYRPEPLTDADLGAILEAARWTGSSKNRQDWSFVVITDPGRLKELARCGVFTQPIRKAVAVIVLVKEPGGNMFDIGRAAQNIMLAAKAIGVASCPVTLQRDEKVRELLGAPEGVVARYAVALGYPTREAGPRNYGGRKRAEEVVKLERYSS